MKIQEKYARQARFLYPERSWPDQNLDKAPRWCSVDLRDGNQALPEPMDAATKLAFFRTLCEVGLKEIEIGFPSASAIEYDFIRQLIEGGHIPDDVTPQVLSQCRRNLIVRTVDSLRGARKAILHLYCSTSPLQRRVVFGLSQDEVLRIILNGVQDAMELCRDSDCCFSLEFSPEHFNETEPDFALRCCEEIAEMWLPRMSGELIFNLPATVETSSPHIFADQVEYYIRHLSCRNECTVSLHTHNDRGCAVAATELALLAGADRVEGTLFGNGERTGNMDMICLAGNLLSQGVDPELKLGELGKLTKLYEEYTGMRVSPRAPYEGELVFTAFSGSHQDAIGKGKRAAAGEGRWEVPYLLVDPADFGRQYEPIVRINSQSGKGGLDFVLRDDYGLELPKPMLADFAGEIQTLSESLGELLPEQIYNAFEKRYVYNQKRLLLSDVAETPDGYRLRLLRDGAACELPVPDDAEEAQLYGQLSELCGCTLLPGGSSVQRLSGPCGRAVFYCSVRDAQGGTGFGAAIESDDRKGRASALISAVNQILNGGEL